MKYAERLTYWLCDGTEGAPGSNVLAIERDRIRKAEEAKRIYNQMRSSSNRRTQK